MTEISQIDQDRSVKKTQPSRKGTKAWRKNIDITPIEETLEEKRKEEMAGGRVADKPNDALFYVDKGGDEEVIKKTRHMKKLRIDEILEQRTAIPAVGLLANKSTDKLKKTKKLSKTTMALIAKSQKSLKQKKPVSSSTSSDEIKPLWGDDGSVVIEKVPEELNSYLAPALPQPVLPPPSIIEKPVAAKVVPPVTPSHPGQSYRPDYDDHQELLRIATEIEEKKLEENERLKAQCPNRQLLKKRPADSYLSMDVDLLSEDDEEEQEQETGEKFNLTMPKPKTKKDRKKEKNRKAEERRQAEEKARKKMEHEIQILSRKKLTIELEEERQAEAQREAEAAKKAIERESKPQKLSQHPYQPVSIPVQLTDELADSLRKLVPEGNLYKERFNNLQKRNIIETRVPATKRRRYELKTYEKRAYKKFE